MRAALSFAQAFSSRPPATPYWTSLTRNVLLLWCYGTFLQKFQQIPTIAYKTLDEKICIVPYDHSWSCTQGVGQWYCKNSQTTCICWTSSYRFARQRLLVIIPTALHTVFIWLYACSSPSATICAPPSFTVLFSEHNHVPPTLRHLPNLHPSPSCTPSSTIITLLHPSLGQQSTSHQLSAHRYYLAPPPYDETSVNNQDFMASQLIYILQQFLLTDSHRSRYLPTYCLISVVVFCSYMDHLVSCTRYSKKCVQLTLRSFVFSFVLF